MGRTTARFGVTLPPLPQPNDIRYQRLTVSVDADQGWFATQHFTRLPEVTRIDDIVVPCGRTVTVALTYEDHAGNLSLPSKVIFTPQDTVPPQQPEQVVLTDIVYEVYGEAETPAVDPHEPHVTADGDESGEVGDTEPPETLG